MDGKKLVRKLISKLENDGYNASIISAEHIQEIRNDIKKHYDKGILYKPFYDTYKAYFEFKPEVTFKSINSIIALTKPVPQFEVKLEWKGAIKSLSIPPTYLYGQDLIDKAKQDLESFLAPHGYKVAYALIPQKTLAVRSGLAKYGKNNITYVSEKGSFHRLMAFYSDLPPAQDNWQDLEMMEACKTCNACIRICPTGAIPTDRFLLHAERCLTYHNEQPRNVPFPDWIERSWHNCLVGCLHCQNVCPANKKVKDWTEQGPSFSEKEVNILLKEENFDNLPLVLKEKLKKYDLANYFEVFSRNLEPFIGVE